MLDILSNNSVPSVHAGAMGRGACWLEGDSLKQSVGPILLVCRNPLDSSSFSSGPMHSRPPSYFLILLLCHETRRQSSPRLLLQWLVGSMHPEWLTHPAIMNSQESSSGRPLGHPHAHSREVQFCGNRGGKAPVTVSTINAACTSLPSWPSSLCGQQP